MKQALFAPNYGNIFGNPSKVIELVKLADEAKWDGFFVYDHVIEWSKIEPPNLYHPFAVLGAIALQTENLKLGTMVTPVNRRRPWILAREALTIDHLSEGRFVLGVGIGVRDSREFSAFQEETDMRIRAEMLDEGLQILKGLWSGENYSFSGKHYSVDNVTFKPKPVNNKNIPIWVAGQWPNKKPFSRAAKYSGIVPLKIGFDRLSMQEYSDLVNYINQRREVNDPFEFVVVRKSDKSRSDESIEELKDYRENGATMHFSSIGDWFGTFDEIMEFIQNGPRNL